VEAKRATLTRIQNAKRFQNEAAQQDKITQAKLTDLNTAVAAKDNEITELRKRLQRAIDQLNPNDNAPTNPPYHRDPDDDDNDETGGNLAGNERLLQSDR
jgi:hypothetical protein